MDQTRLDAVESVFFKRQLEAIDSKVYETKYPQYKSRSLLPTVQGVAETDRVYTYRLMDTVGKAKFVGQAADDLPRADAFGTESSQNIKEIAAAYGYSISEIKAAARNGTPLDALKAMGARRALEEKIDSILALGDSTVGLKGLLGLSSTTTYTPSTKSAGGLTWGTMAAPNATGEEVAMDIMGAASKIVDATKGAFTRFKIVLPIEQYNYAAQKRMGDGSDVTALKFALGTSPYIESVEPWFRCDNAVSGTTDRMCVYPMDPEVVGALVPQEIQFHAPQLRNLEYVVPATASVGGVVCRYPVAVCYMDAF